MPCSIDLCFACDFIFRLLTDGSTSPAVKGNFSSFRNYMASIMNQCAALGIRHIIKVSAVWPLETRIST